MKAVVVLNGAPPCAERLKLLSDRFPVFAADGGAISCLDAGIRPEWVAGDMDSAVRGRLPEDWQVHPHPEQTRTDFQKVMADLPADVTDVLVLGGLGLRTDHLLTNLMIAAAFPASLRLQFEGDRERMFRVTSEVAFHLNSAAGTTVSLLPLTKAAGVRTEGLRWNLDHATMEIGGQLGQSNESTGPVTVQISEGCLYVWVPWDEDRGWIDWD